MDNFKGKASWNESLKDQYTKDGLQIGENSKWKKICTDSKFFFSFFFFIYFSYYYYSQFNKSYIYYIYI